MSITSATITDTALYLVGVAREGSLVGFCSLGLEDGQHTRVIHHAGLAAIVIDVDTEIFCGEDADERLKDVGWLAPRAEKHEAILRSARQQTTVMPIGFGSVFSGEDALAETLDLFAGDITAFLDDTAGCDEWSLKVSGSRAELVDRAKAQIAADSAGSAGAAYLKARRLDGEAESLAEDGAIAAVECLIEDLESVIVDAAERRAISSNDDPDVWALAHIALLINLDTRPAFDLRLDELAPALENQGLRLELSGPWAPYSFCPPLGDAENTPEA